MIQHLEALEEGTILEADVCVIGCGAAGLAVAAGLLNTRLNILLVESGGFRKEVSTDDLNSGESVGLPFRGLKGRERGFGGTTQVWPGQSMLLSDIDFERREWVSHSGWPISKTELLPYYARATEFLRLPAEVFDKDVWAISRVEAPGINGRFLATSYSVFGDLHPSTRRIRRLLARSHRAGLLLHATATRLVGNSSRSRIECIELAAPGGKRATVRARVTVMACGGIENARLLLVSGLGGPLVGRFLQDHPVGISAQILGANEKRLQGTYSFFRHRGVRFYPKIALSAEEQEDSQTLNCAANVIYDYLPSSAQESILRIRRTVRSRRPPSPVDLAALVRRPRAVATFMRDYFAGRAYSAPVSRIQLLAISEQAPNPNSRITLADDRDQFGVPRARVDWRLGELERHTIAKLTHRVAGEFERSGLGQVHPADWLADGSWTDHVHDTFHHMGTTRMADDPANGVVDPNGRVHAVSNLCIAGSSVFPTSGYANPTLTIIALAMRLGDFLRGQSPN